MMGSTWGAPRLDVGAEAHACADSVVRDGVVDPTELVLFATRCFVPPKADARVIEFVKSLVTGVCAINVPPPAVPTI